jgi:Asp-tRNA(Asn)/Glu-tRNA(Gln) amidotransferase C subunit
MPETRPSLSPDTLAALASAAGLALSAAELEALGRPVAAIYAAVDGLDALDLGEAEPAAVFALPRSGA